MDVQRAAFAAPQTAVFHSRARPDLQAPPEVSAPARELLGMRGLDAGRQKAVEAAYTEARAALGSGQGRAFLLSLDTPTLALLQQASALADPIRPATLSEEGAANILLPPNEALDLDDDGVVEVGVARTAPFPPPNAPQGVKQAWDSFIRGMSEGDVMAFSAYIHNASIDSPSNGFGRMGAPGFGWGRFIAELREGNEAARRYNTPEASNTIDAWLRQLGRQLQANGVV